MNEINIGEHVTIWPTETSQCDECKQIIWNIFFASPQDHSGLRLCFTCLERIYEHIQSVIATQHQQDIQALITTSQSALSPEEQEGISLIRRLTSQVRLMFHERQHNPTSPKPEISLSQSIFEMLTMLMPRMFTSGLVFAATETTKAGTEEMRRRQSLLIDGLYVPVKFIDSEMT